MHDEKKMTLYCSFCGKPQAEVRVLIAGPTIFICNECVCLCFDICLRDGHISVSDVLNAVEQHKKNQNSTHVKDRVEYLLSKPPT